MRKLVYAAVAFTCAPLLFAADAEHVVMKTVFDEVARANHIHNVAPAVVRDKTIGGADSFATQWMKKTGGDVIGGELAASYEKRNTDQVDVNDYFPKLVKTIKGDMPYDWTAIDRDFPAAQSVMVFSRPAFDSLNSVAFVRADVIPRRGVAITKFYKLVHQPDDSWKIDVMADATYDSARRSDVHLSH